MGLYPSTCISCKKPFMWFSGNKIQACGECMPDVIVSEEVEIKEEPLYQVTPATVEWSRIRDLLNEADSKLFQASKIARVELKNDDFHREIYKHRVDMQFSHMRVRNALKHDRFPAPFYKTTSELEAELKKGETNDQEEKEKPST